MIIYFTYKTLISIIPFNTVLCHSWRRTRPTVKLSNVQMSGFCKFMFYWPEHEKRDPSECKKKASTYEVTFDMCTLYAYKT